MKNELYLTTDQNRVIFMESGKINYSLRIFDITTFSSKVGFTGQLWIDSDDFSLEIELISHQKKNESLSPKWTLEILFVINHIRILIFVLFWQFDQFKIKYENFEMRKYWWHRWFLHFSRSNRLPGNLLKFLSMNIKNNLF